MKRSCRTPRLDPDFCAVLSRAGLGEGALSILSDEAVFTMDVFQRLREEKSYAEVDRRGQFCCSYGI